MFYKDIGKAYLDDSDDEEEEKKEKREKKTPTKAKSWFGWGESKEKYVSLKITNNYLYCVLLLILFFSLFQERTKGERKG